MGAPYQSQAVSGYDANPPADDGSQVSTNKITWNGTIKTKLSDPLNTFIAAVNSQLVTWSDFSSVTTSTNLTTTTAHHMQTIEVTSGSPTISLGDAATMTKNYIVTVTNEGTGAPVIALATAANTLDGTANGTFTFPTGTKTSVTFKVNNGATGYDTEKIGGKNAFAYGSVFTPTVDSGTTGSLLLNTNNGQTGFEVVNTVGANNWLRTVPNSGSNNVQLVVVGTGTNIPCLISTKGNSSFSVYTNAVGSQQFEVLHTASASNHITVTGSNGGNPTISTTAGNLAITPSVVIAGATLQIGTNASAGNFGIGLPTLGGVTIRNAANSGDIALINGNTFNSVTDCVLVGGSGSNGVVLQSRSKAGAPSTSDISSGQWMLWRDTSGATTKIYYNNAGTLQSVALA